jgi:hypothetical protein
MVLCDASSLCHTVVQACQEKHVHCASTLKNKRRLFKQGWQLKAGRYGKHVFRRRRTQPCMLAQPQGVVCARVVDAGGLEVSKLGQRRGVCSRQGSTRQILGLVTDAPALSGAGLIRRDATRWAVEPFCKDRKLLLGLGHDQNRPDRAAVTHLHLVCFASALLTHLRLERHGAQGQHGHTTQLLTCLGQLLKKPAVVGSGMIWSLTSKNNTVAKPFLQNWSAYASREPNKSQST